MESNQYAMWTEKYRPATFDDIHGQQEIVKRIRAFVKQKNMPHLLFSGPAGVGKTSLSIVIARSLYGPDWRQNFLELNASDERGIDVIRTKVKNFARTRTMSNFPFKIIYLDESDALTREAGHTIFQAGGAIVAARRVDVKIRGDGPARVDQPPQLHPARPGPALSNPHAASHERVLRTA